MLNEALRNKKYLQYEPVPTYHTPLSYLLVQRVSMVRVPT